MRLNMLDTPFLRYVVESGVQPGERLPSLSEIGNEMGISVGKLREQLEVARAMGLVSVKPRRGIQREAFDLGPLLLDGMLFGMATAEANFEQVSQLRKAVEAGFWHEAVALLKPADVAYLRQILLDAWAKLRGNPVHVPNTEHRELHLAIFCRLDNPFVKGILNAYWGAYEASELTRFVQYSHWLEVWSYHERIVDAIDDGDYALGLQTLLEHFALLLPSPEAEFVR